MPTRLPNDFEVITRLVSGYRAMLPGIRIRSVRKLVNAMLPQHGEN